MSMLGIGYTKVAFAVLMVWSLFVVGFYTITRLIREPRVREVTYNLLNSQGLKGYALPRREFTPTNNNEWNISYSLDGNVAEIMYQQDEKVGAGWMNIKLTFTTRKLPFKKKDRNSDVYPKFASDEKYIACMKGNGGQLGNKMFTYASLYGIASNLGYRPLLNVQTMTHFYDRVFSLNGSVVASVNISKQCRTFRGFGDPHHCQFEMVMLTRMPSRGNIKLGGFLQSWMYFYDDYDVIQKDFTFKNDVIKRAMDTIDDVTQKAKKELKLSTTENVTLVGVHVRWGELSKGYARYGLVAPTSMFYKRAMDYFIKRYKNTVFVVCAMFIKWARANLDFKNSPTYFIKQIREVDMATLSLCDHNIISAGTFSFWIGYLTRGEVIYFGTPTKNGSAYSRAYSKHYADFYLPYWIPMN